MLNREPQRPRVKYEQDSQTSSQTSSQEIEQIKRRVRSVRAEVQVLNFALPHQLSAMHYAEDSGSPGWLRYVQEKRILYASKLRLCLREFQIELVCFWTAFGERIIGELFVVVKRRVVSAQSLYCQEDNNLAGAS